MVVDRRGLPTIGVNKRIKFPPTPQICKTGLQANLPSVATSTEVGGEEKR